MSFCDKKIDDDYIRLNYTLPSSFKSVFSKYVSLKMWWHRKRISRFASGFQSATITVEATVVFPLFLAVCISLLFFIEVYRMESCITLALTNTARMMGQYGIFYEQHEAIQDETMLSVGIQALSVVVAEEMVKNEIGKEKLKNSFIIDGKDGLSFLGSYINNGYIKLVVNYKIRFPVPFFELPSFPVVQSCYLHMWSGADEKAELDSSGGEIVYITPYGTVYHLSRDCAYLKLSVTKVAYQQMLLLRNSSGGKYYACEKCVGNKNLYSDVYITKDGNRYHMNRNCSGLKRSVQAVLLQNVDKERKSCSKCKKEWE